MSNTKSKRKDNNDDGNEHDKKKKKKITLHVYLRTIYKLRQENG